MYIDAGDQVRQQEDEISKLRPIEELFAFREGEIAIRKTRSRT
jgi:hypothetical protein